MLTYTKRRQPAKLERHPFFLTFKKLINIFGSIRSQLQRSGYSLWRAGFSLVVVSGPQSTWAQFPSGLWDLSSPNRDQTHIPCIGRQILNHWTTREVPQTFYRQTLFRSRYKQMYQKNTQEKNFMAFETTETLNTDLIFDDNKELLLILIVTMVLWICFLKILIP